MKTKLITTIALSAALCWSATAQEASEPKEGRRLHPFEAGLRFGGTTGLDIRMVGGFEAIIGVWPNAIGLTVLKEKSVATSEPGLDWYYGWGAHATASPGGSRVIYYRNIEGMYYPYRIERGTTAIGIDGIAGIQYKIPPIPLVLSLDLKPFIEVNTNGHAYLSLDPGFGMRIRF